MKLRALWAALAALALLTPVSAQDIKINEIRIDQTGSDNDEYFELIGPPGASLDGLTYIVIGDNTGQLPGIIECVVDLTGNAINPQGFFVVAEDTFTLGTADLLLVPNELNFENSDNVTHLLVEGFSGMDGDDLDTNDDCVLDIMPWTGELDRIALIEEDNPPINTECHYGPPTIGPDVTFVPGHVFRCPDATGDFVIGEFDPALGDDTPGANNNCGNCDAPAGLTCTSNCGNNDVELAWVNPQPFATIEVIRNGVVIATLVANEDSYTDVGVAPGIYTYELFATCPNGLAAAAECPVLFHCPDQTADDGLIITEIVDGTLAGGRPRWVEITNCGSSTVNLGLYSVGNLNNGGGEIGGGASTPLAGLLTPGGTYIFEYDSAANSRFEEVYGFPADQQAGGNFINGDDVVALFYGPAANDGQGGFNGDVHDVYGVIGIDGTGEVWEYTDGYAFRLPGAQAINIFEPTEWTFGGVGVLIGPDDMIEDDEIDLLQTNTFPGAHDCGGVGPLFVRADINDDGGSDISDAIFLLNFLFAVPGNMPPPCQDSADVNDDGGNDISDAIFLLNFLFAVPGNMPPPAPFPDCGIDTTDDALGCDSFTNCP